MTLDIDRRVVNDGTIDHEENKPKPAEPSAL